MFSFLRPFILAATLAWASSTLAADRWSTDETAVRMGVNTWFALWNRPTSAPGSQEVKNLYATAPNTQLPTAIQAVSRTGGLPSAMNQPDRFTVRITGDRAVTSFQLSTDGSSGNTGAQVVLTWERRGGLWRIVQESITPATDTAERVALSEPIRK